jgi:enoyl-CoA hydratase
MSIQLTYPEPFLCVVTINNTEKRNALGTEEFRGLAKCWETLSDRQDIRCIVLTGQGQHAFCSGAQLDSDFSELGDVDDWIDRALLKTRFFPIPLVAAVNGHCVAGGLELMIACDIRIASEKALIGLPEVRWGIVPTGGAALKLVDQIGYSQAMQLLLTGELITAEKALQIGLINQVCSVENVLPKAMAIARQIATNSPNAVRHTKRLALAKRFERWGDQEPAERLAALDARSGADISKGISAFLNKTTPIY